MAKWVAKDVLKHYKEDEVDWFTKAVIAGQFGESARSSNKPPTYYYLRCAVTEARKQLIDTLGKRAFDPKFIEAASRYKGKFPWKELVEGGSANAVLSIQADINRQATRGIGASEVDSLLASMTALRPALLALDLKVIHYQIFCRNKQREHAEDAEELEVATPAHNATTGSPEATTATST